MDATAYLTGLGWRGKGHSLDAGGRGLSKPLLVSRKDNNHGIGKKKHTHTDQWWAKAFDSSLKGLDLAKNASAAEQSQGDGAAAATVAVSSTTMVDLGKNPRWFGGLYGFFVRGEGLRGTLTPQERTEAPTETENAKKKRKREDEVEETKEGRRKRRKEERAAKALKERLGNGSETTDEIIHLESSKEERRERNRKRKAKQAAEETTNLQREAETEGEESSLLKEEQRRSRKEAKKRKKSDLANGQLGSDCDAPAHKPSKSKKSKEKKVDANKQTDSPKETRKTKKKTKRDLRLT